MSDKVNKNGNVAVNCVVNREFTFNFEELMFQSGQYESNTWKCMHQEQEAMALAKTTEARRKIVCITDKETPESKLNKIV